ncbi:uncharacterized protein DDB_G0283357 isoform X2 [Anopheles coustani]|uniref:uncharacterized protein DDB_G0283357 isoform X2 n=1 Tax=Anopheles coustani TaxID=139045 RepID=UPI002658450C|nr:uncharacterized protein DDB_G0283357 isoform X2 [Anopheles coustani]
MELKVWVEGIQRIVCGVTEVTTCQDVVFALAHATGKTGRFTLIERWRNNERLLAPHENPLKILMKWGEYSSDVQFILQRSDQQQQQQQQKKDPQQQNGGQPNQTQPPITQQPPAQSQQQLLRQQQKLNQLNNNHIGVLGSNGHSGPTSPNTTNTSPLLISNGVLSAHNNHINSINNNNNGNQHYQHHQNSNGDELLQQSKSKLHQNNLKNSAQSGQHLHHQLQYQQQQQHHHQHQLSSSSTSSDQLRQQQQQQQHLQSNGVGALIRTGNDPSSGTLGVGGGATKQTELIIPTSGNVGPLERGRETRKSLNSSGSSPETLKASGGKQPKQQQQQQHQNVGIVRGIVQQQQQQKQNHHGNNVRHSPNVTAVVGKGGGGGGGGVTATSDHSSSSSASSTASSSSASSASSNHTSTSSGIGGSAGSGSGGHQQPQPQQQQQQQQQQPVEATYASVIKKPKSHASSVSQSNGQVRSGSGSPAGSSASAATGSGGGVGGNVVGEFNAADLRSSLDRKVNGLVFSNGLNERVPPVSAVVPAGSGGGVPAAVGSVIVGATMKADQHNQHPPHLGTLNRYAGVGVVGQQHYHHTQLQNLLCTDNQHHQHLDTSSISSISSSSVGGANQSAGSNGSNGSHLLLNGGTSGHGGGAGSGATTNSPITGISSNGALVPPPYRDPPPPRNSPLSHRLLLDGLNNNNNSGSSNSSGSHLHHHHVAFGNGSNTLTSLSSSGSAGSAGGISRKYEKDSINMNLAAAGNVPGGGGSSSASSTISSFGGPSVGGSGVGAGPGEPLLGLTNAETNLLMGIGAGSSDQQPPVTGYRELVQLIKLQREKINNQQADITKYDSEILYLEGRSRDQIDQLDALALELSKTDQQYRATSEQLQAFQYVEEESELVRQQEKTLKSELTLLRSKLANCETELLQCKNKIRLLMDEILVEQRKYSRQYDPNRQQLLERHLMCEVDRLQVEIDLAVQSADQANKAHEKLKGEVAMLEGAIADKKKQVEKLVHEMKEVNLQSLAVVPPAEEVRHLLEVGSVKPGSTRRMIGSPRQLENAVPTSKNPHGVWV